MMEVNAIEIEIKGRNAMDAYKKYRQARCNESKQKGDKNRARPPVKENGRSGRCFSFVFAHHASAESETAAAISDSGH